MNNKNSIKKLSTQKGFTLIELLIVISIIGILAGFLTFNFIGARERARDAQRKSQIRQIQSALELYRSDVGVYPTPGPSNKLGSGACPTSSQLVGAPGVVYMQSVPCDPSGTTYINSGNYYYANVTGTGTYELRACLENSNDLEGDLNSLFNFPSSGSICGNSNRKYRVTNP